MSTECSGRYVSFVATTFAAVAVYRRYQVGTGLAHVGGPVTRGISHHVVALVSPSTRLYGRVTCIAPDRVDEG
jgi:hypothetical protein